MPRATTAAWLDLPPTAVRMPFATSMPWMSSGVVSLRTRITGPFADSSTASSAREGRAADCGAGRCRDPGGDLRQFLERRRIEHRVQQLIELVRRDAQHRFLLRDHALFHHVDRDAHRRRAGALAVAGLQHVKLAVFDGELEILHVLVMLFEVRGDLAKLRDRLRGITFSRSAIGCGVRMPATTSSPCAFTRNSP